MPNHYWEKLRHQMFSSGKNKLFLFDFIFFITFLFLFLFWKDEDWVKGIISDRGGGEVALSLESDAVVLMKDCCVLSVVCVCVLSPQSWCWCQALLISPNIYPSPLNSAQDYCSTELNERNPSETTEWWVWGRERKGWSEWGWKDEWMSEWKSVW